MAIGLPLVGTSSSLAVSCGQVNISVQLEAHELANPVGHWCKTIFSKCIQNKVNNGLDLKNLKIKHLKYFSLLPRTELPQYLFMEPVSVSVISSWRAWAQKNTLLDSIYWVVRSKQLSKSLFSNNSLDVSGGKKA